MKRLQALPQHPEWAALGLKALAAEALATGAIDYFEPYEWVHLSNVRSVLGMSGQA